MAFRADEGADLQMTLEEWLDFADTRVVVHGPREGEGDGHRRDLGAGLGAQTPRATTRIQGGIPYAIAKSLAAAPYADLLWMETKTADLDDAREFAEAIHAVYPDKMLAYNLSPSFNWDTTGMTDDEMRAFPEELGKMGFVFNFITYGGHQIDGLAAEEFTTALREDGMLALARLQRKFRLLESPYRTPQTLVGGPRADAALAGGLRPDGDDQGDGRGLDAGQHLVQTEVPPKVLAGWLADWAEHHGVDRTAAGLAAAHTAGSELLELSVLDEDDEKLANIVFATLQDRRGRSILSVRDQNTFDQSLRRKRLMTLLHLFLIHRYKAQAIHYLTPTEDNHRAAAEHAAARHLREHQRGGRRDHRRLEVAECRAVFPAGQEADHRAVTKRLTLPVPRTLQARGHLQLRTCSRPGPAHGHLSSPGAPELPSQSRPTFSHPIHNPFSSRLRSKQALLLGEARVRSSGQDHAPAAESEIGSPLTDARAWWPLGEALLGPLDGRQLLARSSMRPRSRSPVGQVGGPVAVVVVVGGGPRGASGWNSASRPRAGGPRCAARRRAARLRGRDPWLRAPRRTSKRYHGRVGATAVLIQRSFAAGRREGPGHVLSFPHHQVADSRAIITPGSRLVVSPPGRP